MPRKATGTVWQDHGKWFAKITHPDGRRQTYELGEGLTEARAKETAAALSERVREGNHVHLGKSPAERRAAVTTIVEQLGNAWTSGELFRIHGAVNGLKIKKSADVDGWRLNAHVYPRIGALRIASVTEADIERVMASALKDWRPATRVQLYAVLRRLFDLAIMPSRLRTTNPVSRYVRPAKGRRILFSYLFPSELVTVLACLAVPLGRRVLYALAVYTGLRKSSLYALTWASIDLENRTLTSLVSKTELAQMFEIPAGLVAVLRAWRARCGEPALDSPVLRHLKIERGKGGEAEALRADLRLAGVTRAALFQVEENVEPLRFHDLRATFVTWAKRAGKGDGWIADRTGHLTSEMVDRYTRAARTLADLRLEPFPELDGAIPELAASRHVAEVPPPSRGEGNTATAGAGNYRMVLARALGEGVAQALAAGDGAAARLAMATLQGLVGAADAGDVAHVVDLAAARAARGARSNAG